MPGEILRIVLAFAEGVVGGRSENQRTMLASPFVVAVRIGYTNHHQVRVVCRRGSFGQHEASITCFELDAVVGDAQADREAERITEPVRGGADIWVGKNWNNSARRHG